MVGLVLLSGSGVDVDMVGHGGQCEYRGRNLCYSYLCIDFYFSLMQITVTRRQGHRPGGGSGAPI